MFCENKINTEKYVALRDFKRIQTLQYEVEQFHPVLKVCCVYD